MNKYVKFLIENYATVVNSMMKCSHHFSDNALSPYHLEGDIWSHTLMVAKLAELLGTDKNVHLAALLHDIGKPESLLIDIEKCKNSFYGHSGISFWRSIEILNKLELSKEDKIEILSLIALHLDFMNIKNNEGRLRHKFKNNQELLRKLARLYYCDSNGRFSEDEHATREEINTILNTRVINEDVQNKPHQLVLLCGLPCSGKSTFIKNCGVLEYSDASIISRDDILMELSNTDDYQKAWKSADQEKVNLVLEERFIKAVHQRKDVIVDMTNMSRKSRNKFTCRVPKKEYGSKCILFATGLDEITRRNIKRREETNKFIPKEVYLNMERSFTLPMQDEFSEIEWRF